ncbi:MAG: hypothetical protein WCR42_08165 [bacterium]
MKTSDLIKELNLLPMRKRIYVIERTIHSMRTKEEKSDMENAAAILLPDYLNDEELTVFTALDFEGFYEAR